MKNRSLVSNSSALLVMLAVVACGGGELSAEESRAAVVAACDTQQGIGWLKGEYGERYCECYADAAVEVLSEENYSRFVQASRAELDAADEADRDIIVRQNTSLYSAVSSAVGSCDADG